MSLSKSGVIKSAVVAALAATAFVTTSIPASAEIVCNRWHECWHVQRHVVYPARLGLVIRADAWEARHRAEYRWREAHEGRGYWRHGVWHRY